MTELSDYFAYYPDQYDGDMQTFVDSAREFRELAEGNDKESSPQAQGEKFYRRQRLFARLLRAFPRLLNMSAAGVGKTGAYIAAVDLFRYNPSEGIVRAFVLSADKQVRQFRDQLVERFHKDIYQTSSVLRATTKGGKTRALNIAIGDFWGFKTYGEFCRMIRSNYPRTKAGNAMLADDFAGTVFILDEIHFLRVDPQSHSFKSERVNNYMTLWRIVHVAKYSRLILSSASPVVNSSEEFNYILNLLVDLDKQVKSKHMVEIAKEVNLYDKCTFSEGLNWKIPGVSRESLLDEYIEYIHEIIPSHVIFVDEEIDATVSYTPVVDDLLVNDVKLAVNGKRLDIYHLNDDAIVRKNESVKSRMKSGVYDISQRQRNVIMLGIQAEAYNNQDASIDVGEAREMLRRIKEDNEVIGTTKKTSEMKQVIRDADYMFTTSKEISIAVFPDGSFGTHGFNQWLSIKEGITFPKEGVTHNGLTLKEHIETNLHELSAKFYYSIVRAYEMYGKRYVALKSVNGSGCLYYGMCLEHFKTGIFTRYDGTENPVNDDGIDASFGKKARYAILHGTVNQEKFSNIVRLWNHPKNFDGSYIKVIVVSEVGQTGINLLETLHGDMMDAPWNPASETQSSHRILRTGAFEKNKGKEVEINLLVSSLEEKVTIDMEIYKRTQRVGMRNSILMRALKVNAIDAYPSYARNMRAMRNNVDGDPECDYFDCTYIPYSEQANEVNDETYDLMYSYNHIEIVIDSIREYFTYYSQGTLDEIMSFTRTKKKYLLEAINSLIEERGQINDIYGFSCYIRDDGDQIYTTRSAPRSDVLTDITTRHYSDNLIAINKEGFKNVIMSKIVSDISVNNLCKSAILAPDKDEFFRQILLTLSVDELKGFVEVIFKLCNDELQELYEKIYFGNSPVVSAERLMAIFAEVNALGHGESPVSYEDAIMSDFKQLRLSIDPNVDDDSIIDIIYQAYDNEIEFESLVKSIIDLGTTMSVDRIKMIINKIIEYGRNGEDIEEIIKNKVDYIMHVIVKGSIAKSEIERFFKIVYEKDPVQCKRTIREINAKLYTLIVKKKYHYEEERNTMLDVLLYHYHNKLIFIEPRPTKLIDRLGNKTSHRGRVMIDLKKATTRDAFIYENAGDPPTKYITIHYFNSIEKKPSMSGAAKGVTAGSKHKRIIHIGDNEFKDITDKGQDVSYGILVSARILEDETKFSNFFMKLYGKYNSIDNDGQMLIVDKRLENETSILNSADIKTGKRCSNIPLLSLIVYCWELGIISEEGVSVNLNQDELRDVIINSFGNEKVIEYNNNEPYFKGYNIRRIGNNYLDDDLVSYIYEYGIDLNYSKSDFCRMIESHMIAAGRVYSVGGDPDVIFSMRNQKK